MPLSEILADPVANGVVEEPVKLEYGGVTAPVVRTSVVVAVTVEKKTVENPAAVVFP